MFYNVSCFDQRTVFLEYNNVILQLKLSLTLNIDMTSTSITLCITSKISKLFKYEEIMMEGCSGLNSFQKRFCCDRGLKTFVQNTG